MRKPKRIIMAVATIGAIFILFSCAKDPTDVERTPTSTFPLTEGSRWEYSGLWFTVPIDSSASADTIEKEIFRRIIGPDSLAGIADLVVCDDTVISYSTAGVDTAVVRKWVKIEDHQFKMFASVQFQIGDDPDPYIGNEPRIFLDFPLNTGKVWVGGDFAPELSIYEERRVTGIDYMEVPGGWQYCDVVRSDITNILVPSDTIQSAFEWYSNDGLMRFEIDFGINPYLSVRILETWVLIDMDIQP